MAWTFWTRLTGLRRSVSRVPGAPPRTSTLATAPASVRMTVHPVGRSVSVWWPTLIPETAVRPLSRCSAGEGEEAGDWANNVGSNVSRTEDDGAASVIATTAV